MFGGAPWREGVWNIKFRSTFFECWQRRQKGRELLRQPFLRSSIVEESLEGYVVGVQFRETCSI